MKSLIAAIGTAALLSVGASSAFAGENRGNGDKNPAVLNANSICAYSGLDELGFGEQYPDDQDGLFFGAPDFEFDVAQNFGQLVALLGYIPSDGEPGPRSECNGSGR